MNRKYDSNTMRQREKTYDGGHEHHRRRRVNRMKNGIVWTCAILIIIPIIMCLVLMVRLHMLEREFDKLLTMKEQGKIVTQIDKNGNKYLVLAKDADKQSEVSNEAQTDESDKKETLQTTVQETTTAQEETTVDDYTGKRAYLTFDDGPSGNTIPILDTLDACGVKATFFVIGRTDDESLKLYKEIADRGNALALHSYSHDYGALYASIDTFAAEVTQIHDLVQNATGKDVRIFRFPGGSSNTVSTVPITECIKWLKANNYKYVDWNVSSEDATGKTLSAAEIVNIVVSEASGCNSAYILMHDANNKDATVQAIPSIVQQLQAQGFRFYAIDENTQGLSQHIKADSVQ